MHTKVLSKSSDLTAILRTHFKSNMNLAPIKFLSLMIIALCKLQTVCYEKLCYGFESSAHHRSSLRRIQRFMAEYALDVDLIARLIFMLLPEKPPYVLTMDRTNWKFGSTHINILVIAITYQGVAFPIIYQLLPKAGNSNTQERIQIIERYIKLFGGDTIKELLADREFVGEQWMAYLNRNRIMYHLRIRNNFSVFDPRKHEQLKVAWLFTDLKINQIKVLSKIYYINKQLCYLAGSKVKNKQGKPELQIIISFTKPELAIDNYRQRWQIESAFRALKTSGFNIEDTHLNDIDRINKLVAIVLIAFVWAYKVGIYVHLNLKQIGIKPHGRKAKSIFKYGLEYIAAILLNPYRDDQIDIVNFLSCT